MHFSSTGVHYTEDLTFIRATRQLCYSLPENLNCRFHYPLDDFFFCFFFFRNWLSCGRYDNRIRSVSLVNELKPDRIRGKHYCK